MKTVELPTPIKIGETDVAEFSIREPRSGELRGLEVASILRMDYNTHRTLIPRICPQLTANVMDQLSPKNLLAVQTEVVGFFVD
ncbi:phage tail assembly protein [Aeromonas aquatica]|uniref:phage tail assembly protein n=1 Tax=Aeromonas aquatica TaxID=558964 RepID=UPI00051C77B6|nr:phage tail assembly protein [Aeromonas aquatica]